MGYDAAIDLIAGLAPIIGVVFKYLGIGVVVGSTIDAIIPDKYDKGFMGKLSKVPVLGLVIKSLRRFSPFNVDVNKK